MTIQFFFVMFFVCLSACGLVALICTLLFRRQMSGGWNGKIAVHFDGEVARAYHLFQSGIYSNALPFGSQIDHVVILGAKPGFAPIITRVGTSEKRHLYYTCLIVPDGMMILFIGDPVTPASDEAVCQFILSVESEEGQRSIDFFLDWEIAPVCISPLY